MNVSMSGGGKHLWNPSTVVRSGSAMTLGWVRFSTPLSLVFILNFGRVHSLLPFVAVFSLFKSAESVLGDLGRGMDSVYRPPGRVMNTGLGLLVVHACLLVLQSWKRLRRHAGKIQLILMGVLLSVAAVVKRAPSSHELIPFVCLCANACSFVSRSALSQVVFGRISNAMLWIFGQVQAASS